MCTGVKNSFNSAIVSLSLENGSYEKGKCTHCTDPMTIRWYI